MNNTIKIFKIEEKLEHLAQLLSSASLIPVIGSGFSAGETSSRGIVPSGSQMKLDMLQALTDNKKKVDEKKSFSQVATYYNALIPSDIRKKYIAHNFINVKLSPPKKKFLNVNWPYIYTLNIDDAIEQNSDYVPVGPNVELESLALDIKPVYKLHGNAKDIALLKDGEEFSIFDANQYVASLQKNVCLLNKLKQDYIDKNIVFIGCSLDDELDLMHVFSVVKQQNPKIQTEKFFVTTTNLSETELIDLESYGITTVIIVKDFEQIYDYFIKIGKDAKCINHDELEKFKNIPISSLAKSSANNESYIFYGKNPYNNKSNHIDLPYFFIPRDITTKIIDNFEIYPLQLIYGKRISGKSYALLGIRQKIADRDVFYFDSRNKINLPLLEKLLSKTNSLILIDSNVLTDDAFAFLIKSNLNQLKEKQLNMVICVNSSSKHIALELHGTKDNENILLHELSNIFTDNEYSLLKKNLIAINIPYFKKDLTILDNILWIHEKLHKKTSAILKDFYIDPNDYLYMACIILLVYKGKLNTSDLVKYNLVEESAQMMPKLNVAVESDYGQMIRSNYPGYSLYQIVCNAQIWLLGYLSRTSLKPVYFDTLKKAVVYIVGQMIKNSTNKNSIKKEIFEFIQFDNLNYLLGGARPKGHPVGVRRLIQTIYLELKSYIGDQYQFNHQYAKCLLWGIENLEPNERIKDLNESLQSSIIATQIIEESTSGVRKKNKYLQISYAHIQFTICMIKVKLFFFNKNNDSFSEAVLQLFSALRHPENHNAFELYDDLNEDNTDYSVSKFMDYLLSEDSKQYNSNLRKEINYIVNFRFKSLRNE